jgi:outer membrane receptor protein involved in Fe transport
MRKYFLFLLGLICTFALFPSPLRAQGEGAIHGIVIAKNDRSALPNAQIRLEGRMIPLPLQTTSGDDGHFGFQRLVPGEYTVVAIHKDFAEERVRFLLKPREVQNITVELPLAALQESVEVKAEAEPIAGTYSPSSTTLQSQTVEDLPLDRRNNLPDMIAITAPGMIRSHDDFVHVRGHEIALNTFINGVSFWENPHTVFSSSLSPDVIQSVNVMTGGFSAEYGNRFGGVVDVVTKSGFLMNNEGTLTLGVGNALRNNAGIEYGGHTEKAAFYVYSSAFESGRFLSPNDVRSIHDTGRGMHNFLQLDFNSGSKDFFKFVLMGDGTNFQIPKTSLDEQYRSNDNSFERTRTQSAVFTWSHSFSNDTLLSTSFYQRWSHSILLPPDDPLASVPDDQRKNFTVCSATALTACYSVARNEQTLNTTGLKGDLTHFLGRHTLKGGFDAVLLRPDDNLFFYGEGFVQYANVVGLNSPVHLRGPDSGPIRFFQEKTGGQISLYVQDKIQVTKGLTADIGVRYDRYSLAMSDFHFSPRLNLAYRIARTGTVFHASYGHFFAPPAVENVLVSSAGLTRYLQDSPEALPPLRPIVENQFELGVMHPVFRNFHVGLTGYYRISNNPVHTVLFPDSRIYAYANFDKGRAYGMEIKLEVPTIQRLGLSAFLNYALSHVYFWNPVTAGFVDETHHLEDSGRFLAPMDQTHTLNAGFTYRHRKSGLWASMAFEYGSGTPTEQEQEKGRTFGPLSDRAPQHFTQNLTLGWELIHKAEKPRLGLQFNIENLTNNVYVVSQESVFSPGEYFNPRFFSGSVKIRF